MSKFEKLKQLRIGNYFRELSVVIIGVAVTLYASNAITNVKERKDMHIQLNAVYAELEVNLQIINRLIVHYDDIAQLRKYMQADYNNPEQLDSDSLRKYSRIAGQARRFVYKKGAYEMLLYSGAAKHFQDKTLLSDITECYTMMEMSKESINLHMSLKMDLIKKLYDYDTKMIMEDIDWKHPMYRSLYNFYLVSSGGDNYLRASKELIEKVLAK
jgi:Txe/YoeB family toxin of Txe-Axe toxin-antitoxin module